MAESTGAASACRGSIPSTATSSSVPRTTVARHVELGGPVYDDGYGGTYEEERPVELHLEDAAATEFPSGPEPMDDRRAGEAVGAVPNAYRAFLVRAFLAESVDEFLAHITTIEAALLSAARRLSEKLSCRAGSPQGDAGDDQNRGRVAGLLGDRRYADQYEQLFDVRSAFLHGRAMTAISTLERVLARSLARQVVEALILATQTPTASREDFLDGLLDKGAPLL